MSNQAILDSSLLWVRTPNDIIFLLSTLLSDLFFDMYGSVVTGRNAKAYIQVWRCRINRKRVNE